MNVLSELVFYRKGIIGSGREGDPMQVYSILTALAENTNWKSLLGLKVMKPLLEKSSLFISTRSIVRAGSILCYCFCVFLHFSFKSENMLMAKKGSHKHLENTFLL